MYVYIQFELRKSIKYTLNAAFFNYEKIGTYQTIYIIYVDTNISVFG